MYETEHLEPFTPYWSIHSSKDDQPTYRGWGESREQAETRMAEIRQDDGNTEDSYWVIQMTQSELELFQAMGEIPRND